MPRMSDQILGLTLKAGDRLRVRKEFVDEQGIAHAKGETWVYEGYGYLPYDRGLTLYVRDLAGTKTTIRLGGGAADQDEILDHLTEYLEREEVR
jgi:hypothetical protein